MNPYDVIQKLLRTEKGTMMAPQNKYLFRVSLKANKILVRKAVEEIYKVKVKDVQTAVFQGKLKRVRVQEGRTPSWKKAIVTLKEGQKIDLI